MRQMNAVGVIMLRAARVRFFGCVDIVCGEGGVANFREFLEIKNNI